MTLIVHHKSEMNRASGHLDELDDTALQTQDLKFKPWRFEAEHLPLGHGDSPQY